MSGTSIKKKIAVSFVLEAVSFSMLMAKNEIAAMQNLKNCKEILVRLFAEHIGRIFYAAGDSVLAEFQSAVSSVMCTTEFQKIIT